MMIKLAAQSVRRRLGSFAGTFLTAFLAVALMAGSGLLLWSVLTAGPGADRFGAVAAMVAGDRSVVLTTSTNSGDKVKTKTKDERLTGAQPLPADLVDTVAGTPGVAEAIADSAFPVALDVDGVPLRAPDAAVVAHGWSSAALTPYPLVDGAAPNTGEVVLERAFGAEAILDLVPSQAQVISLDNAAAMQRVGRRTLTDPRLTWVTAPAEDLAEHVLGVADAVVCNSAIWKTDVPQVFAAVHEVLRPGGRFVFNIGGGFAGVRHPDETSVRHPDETSVRPGPSLNTLIRQVAARDYGYAPPPTAEAAPKLPLDTVAEHLSVAGLTVLDTEVVAQHSTMAEKKAWLSIPVFARPDGKFTHAQRMDILDKAYALTTPDTPTVTSWLVVVARRPREQP